MPDPLTQLLAALPTAEPGPVRAERIRMRCRARLARQARRVSAARNRSAQVWQPLLALLGVAYLVEAIVQAFGL